MRTAGTIEKAQVHRSASPATDHAAVGLLVALGERFLEAGRFEHAEWTLRRAALTLEAGGYASHRDIEMLDQHLTRLEHQRRG